MGILVWEQWLPPQGLADAGGAAGAFAVRGGGTGQQHVPTALPIGAPQGRALGSGTPLYTPGHRQEAAEVSVVPPHLGLSPRIGPTLGSRWPPSPGSCCRPLEEAPSGCYLRLVISALLQAS